MSVFCICKPVYISNSNTQEEVSKIYQYRNTILLQSKFTVFSVCRDLIFISLPSVKVGMEHARDLMSKSNIPINVGIGKDNLFEAADGSLWGKDIDTVLTLLYTAKDSNEIILSENAAKDL